MRAKETVEIIPTKEVFVGDPKAPITLMEYGDYESEACAKVNEVVFKLAIAVVLVPTPPNVTFWEGKPVMLTVSVPLKVLAKFGLKVTEKLAHCAGWIVTGNVPVGTN